LRLVAPGPELDGTRFIEDDEVKDGHDEEGEP
jgi:hypothetical protein